MYSSKHKETRKLILIIITVVEIVELIMAVFNSVVIPPRTNAVNLTALFKGTPHVSKSSKSTSFLKNTYLLHMRKKHIYWSKGINKLGKAQIGPSAIGGGRARSL